MRDSARPFLLWLLATGAALVAPACLAQQQAAVRQPVDSANVQAAAPDDDARSEERSAFGRVMSIMIAALKQNADAPDSREPALVRAPVDQAPSSARPVHTIQVGAAFRLDEPTVLDQPTVATEASHPPSPGTD